jgi:alkylhydroperoxidase/carboxymuconolactone decarboxylase family protein YurZ
MGEVRTETVDTLRGLASAEPSVVEGLMGALRENLEDSGLDGRAHGLVRLAALIALDAPPAAYHRHVAAARDAGVTPEEILGVLVAIGPLVGVPTVVRAARELALALGLPAPPRPPGASGGDTPAGPGRPP